MTRISMDGRVGFSMNGRVGSQLPRPDSQRVAGRRAAGALAIALAMLVTACDRLPAFGSAAEDETTTDVVGEVKETADRLLTAARDRLGFSTPAAEEPAEEPAPPPAPRPVRPRPVEPPAIEEPAPLPAPVPEPAIALAPVPPFPPAPPTPPPAPPVPAVVATLLYSSADEGIEPPAWRAPTVSPAQLAGSAAHAPSLELIVAADGSVERARLLSASRQLPDMMLLSSAKMWKFEPARLEGQPVRYRLIVRLQDEVLE